MITKKFSVLSSLPLSIPFEYLALSSNIRSVLCTKKALECLVI